MASLCETFRSEAGQVWHRMRRAADLQLFMSEETLTEIALYELARRHQSGHFMIIPATKPQEARHGADWLWWFASSGSGISYRVQAKRLYQSGKYEGLFKKTGDPLSQLKKLIAHSHADGHIPIYCFYNFEHPHGNFGSCGLGCTHNYHAPSYWGCTIALANDVSFANSDELTVLRKFTMPWHLLACTSHGRPLANAAAAAGRILAEPKGAPTIEGDHVQWERPQIEMNTSVRSLPEYVRDMIQIGRRQRAEPTATSHRREIDSRALRIIDEQDLAGLTIFEEIRE